MASRLYSSATNMYYNLYINFMVFYPPQQPVAAVEYVRCMYPHDYKIQHSNTLGIGTAAVRYFCWQWRYPSCIQAGWSTTVRGMNVSHEPQRTFLWYIPGITNTLLKYLFLRPLVSCLRFFWGRGIKFAFRVIKETIHSSFM